MGIHHGTTASVNVGIENNGSNYLTIQLGEQQASGLLGEHKAGNLLEVEVVHRMHTGAIGYLMN